MLLKSPGLIRAYNYSRGNPRESPNQRFPGPEARYQTVDLSSELSGREWGLHSALGWSLPRSFFGQIREFRRTLRALLSYAQRPRGSDQARERRWKWVDTEVLGLE